MFVLCACLRKVRCPPASASLACSMFGFATASLPAQQRSSPPPFCEQPRPPRVRYSTVLLGMFGIQFGCGGAMVYLRRQRAVVWCVGHCVWTLRVCFANRLFEDHRVAFDAMPVSLPSRPTKPNHSHWPRPRHHPPLHRIPTPSHPAPLIRSRSLRRAHHQPITRPTPAHHPTYTTLYALLFYTNLDPSLQPAQVRHVLPPLVLPVPLDYHVVGFEGHLHRAHSDGHLCA